jgi:hypothetical protein
MTDPAQMVRIQAVVTVDVPAHVADAIVNTRFDDLRAYIDLDDNMTYSLSAPLAWERVED